MDEGPSTHETGAVNDMGLLPIKHSETLQCIAYICNLAYSDVLDPCKNAKFPGGLAVSMSRELLQRLKGFDSIHKPYEPAEILAWIHPADRVIPPITLHTPDVSQPAEKGKEKLSHFDIHTLDFGGANQTFDVLPVLCIVPAQIDFGGSDGLFAIL